MGSQTKKETLQSLEQTKYLGQATQTQTPLVSPELARTFSVIPPLVDDAGAERTIDWSLVQQGIAALLFFARRVLQEASLAFRMSKVKLGELYSLRQTANKALGKRHASAKKLVQGTYEPKALPLLGLEVPISGAYAAVRGRCLDAARRMRNPGLVNQIGDPLPGSLPLNLNGLAQGLEDAVEAYDDLESELLEAKKVRDEAFIARENALKRHRRIYVNLARVQEGFYRLAGFDELADRIRVTIPVRKPTQEPDPVTPDPVTPDPVTPEDGTIAS